MFLKENRLGRIRHISRRCVQLSGSQLAWLALAHACKPAYPQPEVFLYVSTKGFIYAAKIVSKVARGRARRVPGPPETRSSLPSESENHARPHLETARPQSAFQPEQHAGDGGDRCRNHWHRRGRSQGHLGAVRWRSYWQEPVRHRGHLAARI